MICFFYKKKKKKGFDLRIKSFLFCKKDKTQKSGFDFVFFFFFFLFVCCFLFVFFSKHNHMLIYKEPSQTTSMCWVCNAKAGLCFHCSDMGFSNTTPWHLTHGRHRWPSWMRRPTGDQKVAGSTPAEVGNILSWRLIMKYFLRSFSPFRWYKKGSCQFLAKECAQYWLTA